MFCKQCGKPIKDNSRFCVYCGKSLVSETSIKQRKNYRSYIWKILFVLLIIIPVLGVCVFIYLDDHAFKKEKIDDLIILDDLGILYELQPFIEPVGYFSKPSFFDSESIDFEEWLSYVEYTEFLFNIPKSVNPRLPNQLQIHSAIVKIICESDDYYHYGSGTNIDSAGYIITNLHILEGVTDLKCLVGFPDPESGLIREAYWATPIIDKENETGHDLAVLSIEDPVFDDEYNIYGFYERIIDGKFPYYEETDECFNSQSRLGDQIFVLGYPVLSGGALTITDGLISSLYSVDGYIITSAKIGPGNSGGLAIDSNGCFVGVPTAVYLEEQGESYGEIIDAYFVYEFYEAVFDYILEYVGELEENVFRHRDQPYVLEENNISAYLVIPGALRECASIDCQVIRYYAEGAKVIIEDVNVMPNWHRVIAYDDYGNLITGYMHSSLFK